MSVREICLFLLGVCGLCSAAMADDMVVADVHPSSPYSIFYQGEPQTFTVTVKTAADLPAKVPLVVRELRCIYYDSLPTADKKELLANREQIVTDKVGEG